MAQSEFSLQPLMVGFSSIQAFDKKEALKKYNALEQHKFILEEGSLECGYYKSAEDDLQEGGGIYNFLTGLRFAGSIRNDHNNVKTLYYTSDENLKQLEGSIANW